MLVGPSVVSFMDEISTGLDSSTTFQIVNSNKQYVHIFNGTAVISLLQPALETYNLFDDIILISDGQIVYQGSREQVLEFFESMGFKCPERKGVADFLQEVTLRKDQEQYWAQKDKPYNFVTVNEFAKAFQSFHVGRKLGDELATQFDKAKSHPAALTTRKYGVKKAELVKACLSREFLLMNRNLFVYIFKFFQTDTDMHQNSVTDIHDRCKASCFLQAKEAPILSSMGIFSSCMDHQDSNHVCRSCCMGIHHLLCHWL